VYPVTDWLIEHNTNRIGSHSASTNHACINKLYSVDTCTSDLYSAIVNSHRRAL